MRPLIAGHRGTTPGQNVVHVHLNRAITQHDLDMTYIAGPGHGGPALDNPDLVVACVVGDGEAETGPLATAWHSTKFIDPVGGGAVLPILHLNGWKISNPTLLARIEAEELDQLLRGCGWDPRYVEGDDPETVHELMATVLDGCVETIRGIQAGARTGGVTTRPPWPMIVLRSPKGWTGPKEVDGLPDEGTFRSHQIPLLDGAHPGHVEQLDAWTRSCRPEELFDDRGALRADLAALAPVGQRRTGTSPVANGGLLLHDLHMPDFRTHAVAVPVPGAVQVQDARVLGEFLRDVVALTEGERNLRLLGPDETLSNQPGAAFEVTDRQWEDRTGEDDEFLARSGRVLDSMLSEHQAQGWLEGHLLTGRHGLFNQHATWLKITKALPWRCDIASLNYLLTSHVWQQDHDGSTHQDPGDARGPDPVGDRSRRAMVGRGNMSVKVAAITDEAVITTDGAHHPIGHVTILPTGGGC